MTPPSMQHRVVRMDNAKYHGGAFKTAPDLIVWHCTASHSPKQTMAYLNSGEKRASYHYLIDRDGMIYRFCSPALVAYHAGISAWLPPPVGRESVNKRSLGVAFANRNLPGYPLTAEQTESALWLGVTLMRLYKIPATHNVAHREVAPGRKTDPLPETLDMNQWRLTLSRAAAA